MLSGDNLIEITIRPYTGRMGWRDLFDALTPTGRVTAALLPFLAALFARVLFGKNRITRYILSLSMVWFTANILMAPFSQPVRQHILNLRKLLW
jgi:hypothetical protein